MRCLQPVLAMLAALAWVATWVIAGPGEPPAGSAPEDRAADAVVTAFQAKDEGAVRAAPASVDPWLVGDALRARGKKGAAVFLAASAKGVGGKVVGGPSLAGDHRGTVTGHVSTAISASLCCLSAICSIPCTPRALRGSAARSGYGARSDVPVRR